MDDQKYAVMQDAMLGRDSAGMNDVNFCWTQQQHQLYDCQSSYESQASLSEESIDYDEDIYIDIALEKTDESNPPDVSLIFNDLDLEDADEQDTRKGNDYEEDEARKEARQFLVDCTYCHQMPYCPQMEDDKSREVAKIEAYLLQGSPGSPGDSSGSDSLSCSTNSPPSRSKRTKNKSKSTKYTLADFMCNTIQSKEYNPSVIKWLNEDERVFLIVKPKIIAELWGARKGNAKMNYPSMSRGIRERRKYGYFDKVPADSRYPKKLTYKFGPKASQYLH